MAHLSPKALVLVQPLRRFLHVIKRETLSSMEFYQTLSKQTTVFILRKESRERDPRVGVCTSQIWLNGRSDFEM